MSSSSLPWDDFDGESASGGGSGSQNIKSRKRKAREMEGGVDAGSTSKVCVSNEIATGRLLHHAVASDDNFLLLIMNVMSNSDLRQIARVNSDWCSMAYQVLRSRVGNRPFHLLWTDGSGMPLIWRNHFHPSLLFKPWDLVGAENSAIIQDTTHWDKLKAQNKFQDVEAIIICGNPKVEDLYINAEAEGDKLPHVKTLILVTAPIVFFSTHNSEIVGDSRSGIQHVWTEGITSAGGAHRFKHVLASLCIPKSSHFSLDCISVNSDPNLWPSKSPQSNSPGLWTKAIVVFQCFSEYDMNNVVEQILAESFTNGAPEISVTSVECTFTTSNESNEALLGTILVFKGDNYVSSIVVDITESDVNYLKPQFHQISGFIGNNQFACFALLFSQCPVHPGTDKFSSENEIKFMKQFRQQFPHVPIQGFGGERPVRSNLIFSPIVDIDALLARDMGHMQCKMDDDTAVGRTLMSILLVKYPLQN